MRTDTVTSRPREAVAASSGWESPEGSFRAPRPWSCCSLRSRFTASATDSYSAHRVGEGARGAQGKHARTRLGLRPRGEPVRLRSSDRAVSRIPSGARPAGRRDGDRRGHRRPGRLAARSLATRKLRRTHPRRRRSAARSRAGAPSEAPHTRSGLRNRVDPRPGRDRGSRHPAPFVDSESRLAIAALGIFALFTAISMAVVAGGFGLTLSAGPVRRSFARLAPALGTASLLFGVWYALGAQGLVPYYF